jgi:hypothetical protein
MTIPDVPRAYDVIAEKFFADRSAALERAGFAVKLCEVDRPDSRGHVAIVARKETARRLA